MSNHIPIRVIFNNETVFVATIDEAQSIADKNHLDLVEVSPNVYKVMDYQKYMYEKNRAKKKQPKQDVKNLKLHLGIAAHDLNRKVHDACNWLRAGAQVVVTVQLRGREQTRPEMGYALAQQVLQTIKVEFPEISIPTPKLSNGRDVTVTLQPRK